MSVKFDIVSGEYFLLDTNENQWNFRDCGVISVNWLLEDSCNLDCIYCFASDKGDKIDNVDYVSVAEQIMKFKPTTLVLTGGEPTLNSKLKDIIAHLRNRTNLILDTNGTTLNLEKLIPFLKGVIIRISIDSIQPERNQYIRPSINKKNNFSNLEKIQNNIVKLTESNHTVFIQTVLTKLNLNELEDIYNFIVKFNIKRWYINIVKYSSKCEKYYDIIKPSSEDIIDVKLFLKKIECDGIKTTLSSEENYGAAARVFVDSSGKFFIDTVLDGIIYIGEDPCKPSHRDIENHLDTQKHFDLYIKKTNIIKP